jgi:thymidylate synthase ThyX
LTPSTHPRLLTLPSLRAILPLLIAEDGELSPLYKRLIEEAFARLMKLQKNGWGRRELLYLLPNATAINIVESSDFLSIYHKMRMRLCYNAQEEIWRLCYEESRAIRQVHPWLGEWLLPPCTLRARGKRRPICPEGSRFCGVKVWELPFSKFSRGI